jgi:tetratricopeptide (TPR) repeat protein
MKLKIYFFLLIFLLTASSPAAKADVPVISENSRVNHLLDQAAQARSDEDLPGAIRYYQQAIEAEPKNYLLHRNLGVLYFEGNDYVASLKSLLKANQLKPDEPYTMIFIAKAFLKTGDADGALSYLEIARQQIPDDPMIYITQGDVLIALNKFDEAEESFEQATELQPNNAEAHFGLGKLYYSTKKYNLAQSSFEEALRYDPTNGNLWFKLGMTYFALNDLNKAAECMHRSLTYDPNNPETFNALGLIFQKARMWDLAEKSFSKAIAIDPNYEEAIKNRQGIPWKKQETTTRSARPYGVVPPQAGTAAVIKTTRPFRSGPSQTLQKDHLRPSYDSTTGYDPRIGYADTAPDDSLDALAAIGNSLLKGLFGKKTD